MLTAFHPIANLGRYAYIPGDLTLLKPYKQLVPALFLTALGISQAYAGDNSDQGNNEGNGLNGKHVLLISIDGMHELDFENCVNNNTCPWLASLGKHGVTYPRTSTSKPS